MNNLPTGASRDEPPAPSAGTVCRIRKGNIIQLTVEVLAENDCEVEKDELLAIANEAVDSLLDHAPDLSTSAVGYHISRPRRRMRRVHRRTRDNPGDRQRTPEIPDPSAGGKAN